MMYCQLWLLMLVSSSLVHSQDAEPSPQKPLDYGFLKACASQSEQTASASFFFLFFDSTSAAARDCLCTFESEGIYTVKTPWGKGDLTVTVTTEKLNCNVNKTGCLVGHGDAGNVSFAFTSNNTVDVRVLVVFDRDEGNGSVTITCRNTNKVSSQDHLTDEPSPQLTTPLPDLPTTDDEHSSAPSSPATTRSSSTIASPLSPSSASSPTSHGSLLNSSPSVSTDGLASPDPSQPAVTGSPPVAGGRRGVSVADTTVGGTVKSVRGNPAAIDSVKRTDDETGISGTSLAVLAVGISLSVLAVIFVIGFVVHRRCSSNRKDNDSPREERSRQRREKRNGHTMDTSRDSLLDRHNYEEVSEDGISGVDNRSLQSRKQAKSSHEKSPPRKASGQCAPQGPPPQKPSEPPEDEYNKLNLRASARGNGALAKPRPRSRHAQPVAADEDSEYMEISNDDIYEAVEDEGTPLCSRKRRSKGEEYTDCVSVNDLCGGGAAAGAVVVNLGTKSNSKDLPKTPSTPKGATQGQTKPNLPTTAPPTFVRQSKSAENLTDDVASKATTKHKQSKSVDLRKMNHNYQNTKFSTPGSPQRPRSTGPSPHTQDPLAAAHTTGNVSKTQQNHNNLNTSSPMISSGTESNATEACLRDKPPTTDSNTDSNTDPNQDFDPDQVVMRPKSRAPKLPTEAPTMLDHLKEQNPGLLAFQEAVRSSMEINEDELVMIDNILYGTLPRDLSQPTTEL